MRNEVGYMVEIVAISPIFKQLIVDLLAGITLTIYISYSYHKGLICYMFVRRGKNLRLSSWETFAFLLCKARRVVKCP